MTVETKHNIGDEVWVVCGGNRLKGRVIDKDDETFYVKIIYLGNIYVLERSEYHLFPTKEELLKSL